MNNEISLEAIIQLAEMCKRPQTAEEWRAMVNSAEFAEAALAAHQTPQMFGADPVQTEEAADA